MHLIEEIKDRLEKVQGEGYRVEPGQLLTNDRNWHELRALINRLEEHLDRECV